MRYDDQISIEDTSREYQDFVDKFKPRKTTDDCYTPPNIYACIKDWVCRRYSINPDSIVRPFYPGGDFEMFDYPAGCCVLDNPPFSILSRIVRFYIENNILFFLFAPSLTCFNKQMSVCKIVPEADIMYDNGAVVQTAFVTNMEDGIAAMSCTELHNAIKIENDKNIKSIKRHNPKYKYPKNVLTVAMLQYMSKHGVDFSVSLNDVHYIGALDSQKRAGKSIFGGGFLLSEKAAAEKAAAEKAAAEKAAAIEWSLSDRERMIISSLGSESKTNDEVEKNE